MLYQKKEQLLEVLSALMMNLWSQLEKAEGKDNMSLVMKANYIKRKSQEKSCKILSLEEAVAVIAEKGRKLRNKVQCMYE